MRSLPIVNPCSADWDEMAGSRRARHCTSCARPVYDLSAMRETEARAHLVLLGSSGLCVRFTCTTGPDGEGDILHAPELDERRGSSAARPLAAGLLAAALSLANGHPARADQSPTPSPAAPQTSCAQSAAPPAASPLPASAPASAPAPAAVAPAMTPATVVKVGGIGGTNLRIYTSIQFARGSSTLSKRTQAFLEEVVHVLREHPELTRIAVEGHTSSDEPDGKKLSTTRARAVVAALVAAQVDPARLVIESYGDERPLNTNKNQQERDVNRRVQFHILDRPGSSP